MAPSQPLRLDTAAFLARHWQREPLLIRQAVVNFQPPLSADELAGLAMEEEVESRIIDYDDARYQLSHGPFSAEDFSRQGPWTLLVQAVDRHLPAVDGLLDLVDFIPRWRVDDIMISYAVDGGGVGPHYDNYDVFLLQAEGKRRWRVGQGCDSSTPLQRHDDLRLLAEFDCSADYILEPGDILYLPPGVAHWGTAIGESMTYSLGFRAPRVSAMVSRWADRLLERIDPDVFYRDPNSSPALRAGEIRPEDRYRAREQLLAALGRADDTAWFGEVLTEDGAVSPLAPEADAVVLNQTAGGNSCVARYPGARIAWQEDGEDILVFANGEQAHFKEAVLPHLMTLCSGGSLAWTGTPGKNGQADSDPLIGFLLRCGCLCVE